MLIFGKNWKTRFTLDSQFLGHISHKVERSVRSVTISYIHHTSNQRQHCHVGMKQRAYSKTPILLELCLRWCFDYFWITYNVPISLACKKQTAVSYASIDAEIISLDTRLRMEGIPALNLWDTIIYIYIHIFCTSMLEVTPCQFIKHKYQNIMIYLVTLIMYVHTRSFSLRTA